MKRELHIIVAVHITDRVQHAGELQKVLSEFGCYIKTRIGLHEASEEYCSSNGIIILEMLSNEPKADEMIKKISAIEGLECQKIVFDHESENLSLQD
jgi:hypothetical protein